MQHPTATALQTEHLMGLELMRFVCAISVLVWHYQHFHFVGITPPVNLVVAHEPLYGLLQPFYQAGWLGVQLFWALSGFIFFWKYAEPVSRGVVTARHFAWLRFSRLYPLHLLTLLAVVGLGAWFRQQTGTDFVYPHNTLERFGLQLLLASEWDGRSQWSFNGPIWSVSIEVLVYALFFACCRLGWIGTRATLGVVATTAVAYALKLTAHPVVLCAFFFWLGGLTQQAAVWLTARPRHRATVLALAAVALLGATALMASGRLRPMFWVALLAPVGMLWLVTTVRFAGAKCRRWVSALGNTTYGSYLLHYPVQLAVMCWVGGDPTRLPLDSPAWLLGYLAVTFGLAHLSFRFFEKPAQAALRRWA